MAEGRIVILGAGSHASVVLDILQSAGHADRVEGFVDCGDGGSLSLAAHARAERPVAGSLKDLSDLYGRGVRLAVLGVGSALLRERLLQEALKIGFGFISAIHPSAVIGEGVSVGRGANICANAVIVTGSQIGQGCIINTAATVDHDCRIDEFAHVCPGVHLAGNVQVGAYSCVGIGSSVIQGLSIGAGSFIGAGAAVVTDIPEGVLACGVPARVVRPYDLSEEMS